MRISSIAAALFAIVASPLAAQDAETSLQPQQGSPPERIDLLAAARETDEPLEDCSEEELRAVGHEVEGDLKGDEHVIDRAGLQRGEGRRTSEACRIGA